MSGQTAAAYVFGPFRLDLEAGELWRGDQHLEVRPKVFDLLVFMIQNRGKVLTKETIFDQVWNDVVVSETSLTRTMADLRELLQDDADRPRYIQTAPRRGYKFFAAVEEVKTAASFASRFTLLHAGEKYGLHEGDQLIGRGEEVEIRLFTALTSRHHARVHVSGDAVTVEDLGSMNGTLVNNTRLNGAVELTVGDEIEIGGERLVLWSPTASTTPAQKGRKS